MSNELNDAVETTTDGKRKVLCIYLTNPSFENPERTSGDYRAEQQEARERHAMLQEQHRVLLRSYRANLVLATATVLVALATCGLVYLTYLTTRDKPTSTAQLQEQPLQQQQSLPAK